MAVSALCRPMSRKLESVSSNGKARSGIDRLHAVALGDHLAEQAFLRAEVVEEARRRHPHPLGQRRHPRAAVALGGEELDRGVNDLLPAQVAPGLPAVLVGPGVLPEGAPAAARERRRLLPDPPPPLAMGSLDPAPGAASKGRPASGATGVATQRRTRSAA